MSNYCTLKDINKAAGTFNLALPDDLIRARREAQQYIESAFSGMYDTTRFSSAIPIIRELTAKYAAYIVKKSIMLNTGVSAEDIENDEETRTTLAIWKNTIKNLQQGGDITIEVTESSLAFDANDKIRLANKRPRDVVISSGGTKYHKNEDYTIDYDASVIFRVNKDMPASAITVVYNSSLRK